MSAPTTTDPLVVTTADGTSWWRRAVTQDGRGLYAVAGVCNCPPYLMSTLATLAEHGIRGQADALPMPVGSKPQMDADRTKAPWGRGEDGRPLLPMGAHWTDVPELVDQYFAGIQARVDAAQPGSWYVSPTAEAPDTVCTQYDGYTQTVGRFTNVLPADLALVLHARSDLRWCLGMIAKLRDRVADLEAGRDSANEVLDDAAEALRARQVPDVDRSADKLTRLLAPTQALRVEAEPQGCGRCGIPEREHMQRWKPSADGAESGWHEWIAPTQEQLKARMLARREANSGGGAE